MEELKKAGKVKSIGVSNYLRHHVEATLEGASDPPAFKYHPYFSAQTIGSFKGLAPAFCCPNGPLREPLARVAKAHDTTEVVVLLAWVMQNNIVAVTTTSKPQRLDEYARVLKVKLTPDEMQETSRRRRHLSLPHALAGTF
ncbi:NADPH-dependent alpha-keto amide reductase, putative [Metarhizium acridum CQMa 102]|uniref:NADPH-dependent alpha-keto amide reductase, putative n=1 Tax=Metarhizium acridum (strain CQMa 102) TaxID=655827 RepID=E9DRF3_METAQ|nr:NADPH-dependent alpha-keto amide reductase, putative [Metarhizium acridum CQMa 102]EFY93831.1 NADPH-dependent alpha-keto amide reductase, putative [Metarhizium acridum CQMa 102]